MPLVNGIDSVSATLRLLETDYYSSHIAQGLESSTKPLDQINPSTRTQSAKGMYRRTRKREGGPFRA